MMTDQNQSNYDALTFTFKETISVINDKNTKCKKTKSALIKSGGINNHEKFVVAYFFAFLTSFW